MSTPAWRCPPPPPRGCRFTWCDACCRPPPPRDWFWRAWPWLAWPRCDAARDCCGWRAPENASLCGRCWRFACWRAASREAWLLAPCWRCCVGWRFWPAWRLPPCRFAALARLPAFARSAAPERLALAAARSRAASRFPPAAARSRLHRDSPPPRDRVHRRAHDPHHHAVRTSRRALCARCCASRLVRAGASMPRRSIDWRACARRASSPRRWSRDRRIGQAIGELVAIHLVAVRHAVAMQAVVLPVAVVDLCDWC